LTLDAGTEEAAPLDLDLDLASDARSGVEAQPVRLSHWDLFVIFLKGGLALGGGLGIMAALENELVCKRRAVTREDFLATYALGRLVPSGTMTAVAVAYGYRFGGWLGTVIAMAALVLPSTLLSVLLTMGYGWLHDRPVLGLISRVVLPTALALIVVPALKFAKQVSRSVFEMAIAVTALLATLGLGLHPTLVLLAGGLAGLAVSRLEKGRGPARK
jgi:chromate transporter